MTHAGFLPRAGFQGLLDALRKSGYRCIGPRARDGAIVYDTVERAEQFPRGIRDVQSPGQYRLVVSNSNDPRLFAWANGPQALKPLTFASRETLWRCERGEEGQLHFAGAEPDAEALAVVGVRACDLAALRLQDQHFLEGPFRDPYYGARRDKLFLIAVHCVLPATTCFCVSTGDGPRATHGFDLALAELDDGFIVEAGTTRGGELLERLSLLPVSQRQRSRADREIEDGARRQTRRLPSRNLHDALFANLDHPRWEDVAQRCLSCGNCTAVCPTCFCHAEVDEAQLDGAASAHVRQWDSCFTKGHSYIHGITIRPDRRTRYRQWMTHKLGSWHDQYGRSGCVGCGRCITWCPVGIDITDEAQAICGETAHG